MIQQHLPFAVCSTNQVAGTKALKVVDDLKLYLGCAATGEHCFGCSYPAKGFRDVRCIMHDVAPTVQSL